MKIIFKHTLKNIFHKPLRTLLILFCVIVCSFAAMLCFDMTGAIRNCLSNILSSNVGKMDVRANGDNVQDIDWDDENLGEATILKVYYKEQPFYRRLEDEYAYIHADKTLILGLDFQAVYDMEIFKEVYECNDDEVILNDDFADAYGYKEGDRINLRDVNKKDVEFTVRQVVSVEGQSFFAGMAVYTTVDGYKRLDNLGTEKPAIIMVDFLDDSKIAGYVEYLEKTYPTCEIMSLTNIEALNETLDMVSKVFFVLFALCFLMVIFVSISISERIVVERMSVVGTMRSLGVSTAKTTFVLLFENGFYGLTGGIIGAVLYTLIRDLFLGSIMAISGPGEFALDFGQPSPVLVISVIVLSVVIECLCPIKELIRAIRTPIRDIIFENKDTKYNLKKSGLIVGGICVLTAIVLAIVPKTFVTCIVMLGCIIVAVALLMPGILTVFGRLLGELSGKMNFPILRLASYQMYTKKSNVGATRLIATACALAIVVFSLAQSEQSDLNENSMFSSDLMVQLTGEKDSHYFSYIESQPEVTEVEMISLATDYISVNGGEKISASILGDSGKAFDMFKAIGDCPTGITDDEIVLDKKYAKKNNIKVGDTIQLTLAYGGYFPREMEFTVKALCDGTSLDISGQVFILSGQVFENIYGNYPSFILINSDDPKKTDKTIEKYSVGYYTRCYTAEEYALEEQSANAGVTAAIYAAIAMGIGLTFIGATSNLLIGFEARKRECAVLCSTSMSRKKVSRMLFFESTLASAISLLVSIPGGFAMIWAMNRALDTLEGTTTEMIIPLGTYAALFVILWAAFTLTALLPMRKMKKMKLSEQLKYE